MSTICLAFSVSNSSDDSRSFQMEGLGWGHPRYQIYSFFFIINLLIIIFFGGKITAPVIVDDSMTDVIVQSLLEFSFSDEDGNGQSESEERLPDLPLLSEQLLLDELWDMLGECLKELEESHDQHAVLGTWNLS